MNSVCIPIKWRISSVCERMSNVCERMSSDFSVSLAYTSVWVTHTNVRATQASVCERYKKRMRGVWVVPFQIASPRIHIFFFFFFFCLEHSERPFARDLAGVERELPPSLVVKGQVLRMQKFQPFYIYLISFYIFLYAGYVAIRQELVRHTLSIFGIRKTHVHEFLIRQTYCTMTLLIR